MAAVGPSVGQATRYTQVNVLGTINVLDAARDTGVGHVVMASSSTVYGDTGGTAFREDQPLRPMSPYGATKVAAEAMGQSYAIALRSARHGAALLQRLRAARPARSRRLSLRRCRASRRPDPIARRWLRAAGFHVHQRYRLRHPRGARFAGRLPRLQPRQRASRGDSRSDPHRRDGLSRSRRSSSSSPPCAPICPSPSRTTAGRGRRSATNRR